MLKNIILKWLGVDFAAIKATEESLRIQYEARMERFVSLDGAITSLRLKFMALEEALGVQILDNVVNNEGPKIVSNRDDGLLGKAQEYLDAVTTGADIIKLQINILRGQESLYRNTSAALKAIARKNPPIG